MCGIAGFLTSGAPSDPALLRHMSDRLYHRGPDAYGSFTGDGAGLGHRRLSIIDLASGQQPLSNEDGSLQIVFNGEIYNYLELRKGLVDRGHRFQTNSDTEVMVHLYEEVGEELPGYLNGMFALAIWDRQRRELFLARDRFGKKPLYYSTEIPNFRIAFASELKALAAMPGFKNAIDERSVADFLALSYVPDPGSIYRCVRKLPPGHWLKMSARGVQTITPYWEPLMTAGGTVRPDDAIEEINTLAADAVKRRMISDVPLGAFLSGGVDSGGVVAFMSRAGRKVKTFSIGFTNKEYDELEYARMVAARYQTEHSEEVVTPSIEEIFEKLVDHYDEPFGDASAIPSLYLARMTRRFVTVALSGDGADELFGGYRRYYFGQLEERIKARFPDWFRTSVFRLAGDYYPKFDFLPRVFRAKTLLSNLALAIGDSYFTSMSTFRDQGLGAVLSPSFKAALDGYSPRVSFARRFERFRHLPPLQQMQAVDLETYLPGDILVKADRSTMAYSLEGRSPWLDYRIAELSFRLPAGLKIHGPTGKFVFKKALEPYLPAAILWRPKMGFAVPLPGWFRTSLIPLFEKHVLRAGDMEQYLSLEEVKRLWNQHQSGLQDHSRKLWNLLMLAAWHKRWRSGRDEHTAAGHTASGVAPLTGP